MPGEEDRDTLWTSQGERVFSGWCEPVVGVCRVTRRLYTIPFTTFTSYPLRRRYRIRSRLCRSVTIRFMTWMNALANSVKRYSERDCCCTDDHTIVLVVFIVFVIVYLCFIIYDIFRWLCARHQHFIDTKTGVKRRVRFTSAASND